MKKIVIMAGGTGGHVFPGLAIAEAFKKQGAAVSWLGSVGGMETQWVTKAGIPLQTLTIQGLRGKSRKEQLLVPFRLCHAIYQAYIFLKRERPDAVIGMGGFAAGPGGIAAKLLGIPLIIHEQNSVAGLTNRYLAKIAARVLCAFPNTFPPSTNAVVTGNPVRADIIDIPPPEQRQANDPPQLLILGGSRGAKILNEIVPQTLALIAPAQRPAIWHQTGQALHRETQQLYQSLNIAANITPFIDDMKHAYLWADVIVCRAGALTLAELTQTGIAAVLIPYPHAVDDHQMVNARFLEKHGAAYVLPQQNLSTKTLLQLLMSLLDSAAQRLNMAQAARKLCQPAATQQIIQQCFDVMERKKL